MSFTTDALRSSRRPALFSLSALGFVLVACGSMVVTNRATSATTDKSLKLPIPLSIDRKGALSFDKAKWKVQRDDDGTELLTLKDKSEAKAAILKGKDGAVESVTTYALKNDAKEKEVKALPEDAATVFFKEGTLAAFTQCTDEGKKGEMGRICVTATLKLCQQLKAGAEVNGETIKEMDLFEMRALALLLTLRGSDHQLDNMLRSGNRLGLKSGLQTTKGQLLALAKQIAKETAPKTNREIAKAPADAPAQSPRLVAQNDGKTATDKDSTDEVARTREVLEKTLPRLKEACVDTGFL